MQLTELPTDDLPNYPWLYLREGKPLSTQEQLVELLAVGDMMPERLSAEKAGFPQQKPVKNPFDLSTGWLEQADLTLGNLEGVFDWEGGASIPTPLPGYEAYRLVIPPAYARLLNQAGFDFIGLANNHALDLGETGLENTLQLLEENHIQALGIHNRQPAMNTEEDVDAIKPVIVEIKGIRLALLAVNAVPLPAESNQTVSTHPIAWDEEKITREIQDLRSQVDVIAVSIHWGYEYELQHDPLQEAIARQLSQAGADLVVGHHPHVVQGTQVLKSPVDDSSRHPSFVAYSLGNFVFDQADERTTQGLAIRVFLDRAGIRAVLALPVQGGTRPRLLSLAEAQSLLERIQPELPSLAYTCTTADCRVCDQFSRNTTILTIPEAIDLTGDGMPETVQLKDKRVSIFEAGSLAWQSPVEWQVLDLALGDPNDDGRFEAILALLKPDDTGVLRSHPFIIGYRGGIYRQVWGGSAVSEPIHEIELADVDADHIQELIVLDELPGKGTNTVGVWKWNGWGFSLNWRSQPGKYQELRLTNNGFRFNIIP